jgi:hypothetical protein
VGKTAVGGNEKIIFCYGFCQTVKACGAENNAIGHAHTCLSNNSLFYHNLSKNKSPEEAISAFSGQRKFKLKVENHGILSMEGIATAVCALPRNDTKF